MISFKQFLESEFNDDDWYLVDTTTKKVVKNIGGPSSRPDEKFYLTKPELAILKGMKAKFQGYKLNEDSKGAHGEYANDVAEKTMVHAIINQLHGGAKTEKNYDEVYSFLESDLASDFYDKYYKTFEEDSERRKAKRMKQEVKPLSTANATLMGEFRKELPKLYAQWKKSK